MLFVELVTFYSTIMFIKESQQERVKVMCNLEYLKEKLTL